MAALGEQESETQLCNNCQKDIPLANFTIHEIHCSRNIGFCPLCKESFPKAEMRTHQEQEHAQIVCKCSMRMDRGLLQDHVAFECPLRPVACQHCDIELPFCKLQDHEDYCGARTQRCGRCSRNVMLRELKTHPIDCGKKAGGGGPGGQAKPPFNPEAPWRNIQTISNILQPDSTGEAFQRSNRFLETQLQSWIMGDHLPRESSWRNRGPSQPDRSRARLGKTPPLPVGGEPEHNLDYLLALSLQHENSVSQPSVAERQRELWKNIPPHQTRPTDHCGKAKNSRDPSQDLLVAANNLQRPKTETLLPCEFCEELYPEGDLIRHQTGCNPASALASFSKRSNLVPPTECLSSLWGEVSGHRSVGSGETFPPQQEGTQESLLLPCEFCGVQLEEEILFHHQDQCDWRPATAPSSRGTPAQAGSPVPESSLGTKSPQLLRRPIRPQGERCPQYLEQQQQQQQKTPFPPAPRSYSQVAARRVQLATPNHRREDPAALSKARKPRKPEDGKGRTPGRSPRGPAAARLPTRPPSSDFAPSTYVPSFPLAALPTRPSIRQEGGQSPAAPPHFNNAKAKLWQVKSADPERE